MTSIELPLPHRVPAAAPARSPLRMAFDRFAANRLAVLAVIGLAFFILACYGTLPWTLHTFNQQNLNEALQPPSWRHWMGTDTLGRDLLARFLLGGAISLMIGVFSALVAVGIGLTVGLVSGYVGGRLDAVLMRAVDVLYGLPYILLVILLRVALVGRLSTLIAGIGLPQAQGMSGIVILLVGIGGVSWLTMARVIRSQTMSLVNQPYVEAARATGASPSRILLRHILPNLVGSVAVYAALTVPSAILAESFLSFLGLGVQPPIPTWGNLAASGVEAINPIHTQWWLITWPCVGLTLALLCLNFLGDALRDALDVRTR
jgi:ABC-type dipeptide/oligopeptide/nickel transport system permease subunit